MADKRLERADATKLDELRSILAEQDGAEHLCAIEMADIDIGHGALANLPKAVKSLTEGKKVLMVTDSTQISDIRGGNVKKTGI